MKRVHWIWLAAVVLTFFAVDCLSLHTGDDLGYMFADTVHHGGGGQRVTTLWQCLTTQGHHYMTTNGRFAVHVTVMAMLNLVPLWLFRAVNAVMFGLLWLALVRMAGRRSPAVMGGAWLLLLAGFPQPGLTLFTLVAYAVNYLWVSVAAVWLLWCLFEGNPRLWWLLPVAFVVGTLHEGWSLPLCAILGTASLMGRVPWSVTLCLAAGTAVELVAPGNRAHLTQGGGLGVASIATHTVAMGAWLLHSLFLPSAVAFAACAALRWHRTWAFFMANLPYFAGIGCSLALGALTFTAPRQLTCASVLTMILILKACDAFLCRWRPIALAGFFTAVTAAILALMAVFKVPVYQRWQTVLASAARGDRVVQPVTGDTAATNNWLRRAVAPDPLVNCGLMAPGDRYTVQGLSRLRIGPRIQSILPYPRQTIVNACPGTSHYRRLPNAVSAVATPIGAYTVTALPDSIYARLHLITPRCLAAFTSDGRTYIITEPGTRTITATISPKIAR